MTNRNKSEFTSHFGIAAKTNLLLLFPTRYAHARHSSRMIDRFLNWGDHGKPKSGKTKGRCQPSLAVRNARSWKRVFLAWLFSWMIRRRRRERPILLSFLSFYGLMVVGKYALICTMEIQKIHMVVHIFSGFALFTELMWVYRGVESLCKLLTANKVPFDLPTNECKSKYCPS